MYYMIDTIKNYLYFVDRSDPVSLLRFMLCAMMMHLNRPIPLVAAYRGGEVQLVVALRPYDQGGHMPPIREVIGAMIALNPDHLAFGATGRAWSALDPIPPVCPSGDLRTQVVLITEVATHPLPTHEGCAGTLWLGQPPDPQQSTIPPGTRTDGEARSLEEIPARTFLWPLEECFTPAPPTVLENGSGEVLTCMRQSLLASAHQDGPRGNATPPPDHHGWDHHLATMVTRRLHELGHQVILRHDQLYPLTTPAR